MKSAPARSIPSGTSFAAPRTNSMAKVLGAAELVRKMKAHPELIAREVESILRQEARALCVEYARLSGPGRGMTEAPLDKARKGIAAEMNRTIATRQNPAKVFLLMKQHDPVLANAYWYKHKSRMARDAGGAASRSE